jgi:hypothetical protein
MEKKNKEREKARGGEMNQSSYEISILYACFLAGVKIHMGCKIMPPLYKPKSVCAHMSDN